MVTLVNFVSTHLVGVKVDLSFSFISLTKWTKKNDWLSGNFLGTMIGFIEFSQNKELQDKIETFVALAPVTNVNGLKGAMGFVSKFSTILSVRSKPI